MIKKKWNEEPIPRTIIHMNWLEEHGKLQEQIELGLISSRKVNARKLWMLVDINIRVHGMSKTKAVEDGCYQMKLKSTDDGWKMLRELKDPLFKVSFDCMKHF